jgi:hypothetical protein
VRLVVEGDGRQTRKFPSVNGSDRRRRCGTLMESATCQFPCPLSRSMEVQTPDPAEHRTRECEYCHAEMVRLEKLPGINIRTVLEIFHCRGCNNYASRGHAAPFRRALRPVKTRRSKCFINCEAPVCTCCSAALLRGRHLVRTPSGGFLFGPIGKANIQVRSCSTTAKPSWFPITAVSGSWPTRIRPATEVDHFPDAAFNALHHRIFNIPMFHLI